MPFDNEANRPDKSNETPVRPWGPPAAGSPADTARAQSKPAGRRKIPLLSILFFVLMLALVGGRAYQELSTPQAWAYWKDSYFSPGMAASLVQPAGGTDQRTVLAVSGEFGPAAASWFRGKLDEAKLRPGDTVAFSSPGGQVDQAIIIGEILRSRGLKAAVASYDADGRMRPSYCASACVLAYAGGTVRIGVPGSALGVHRFRTEGSGHDLVAETQRTTGIILGYMTRMGVASSVMEAMSATDDIRWLTPQQAVAMKLVTDPIAQR
jgi:hypothetical protein